MNNNRIYFLFFFIIYLFPSQLLSQFRSEYISLETHYIINDNKLTKKTNGILQINERMGDRDASVAIYYKKGDKVNIGNVWIEDMQGNVIRKLDKKEIKDRSLLSNSSFYSDEFIKQFEMKHNIYPYRIVYSYERTLARFLGIEQSDLDNSRQPLKNGTTIVEVPMDQPIKYNHKNIKSLQIDTIANAIQYTWKYDYTPPAFPEVNSSVNKNNIPYINIVPQNFKYGVQGSFDSWSTFGNYVYRLNKNRDVLTDSEKAKIDDLLSNAANDREKAKILYYYLQDYTRYINVNIKIGGFQTYPAEYVCINKYGDCKALTNYMMSMLAYAGIKSYYTLIYSSPKVVDTDVDFPSQSFNHAILTLPLDNDTIYIECTSKNTPFGYIHTSIQNRKALIVDENDSRLTTIPPITPENVLCSRTFNVNLDASSSSADIEMSAIERGYDYEFSGFLKADINKNDADKYIRNTMFNGSFDLKDYEIINQNRDSAMISLKVNCKMHNVIKRYGSNIIFSPFPIYLPPYEAPEKRTQHLQIDYPQFNNDTISYKLSNISISKIPEDIILESDYGHYHLKFEIKEDRFIIYKSLLITAGRYSLSEYKDFYEFISTIKSIENTNQYIEIL